MCEYSGILGGEPSGCVVRLLRNHRGKGESFTKFAPWFKIMIEPLGDCSALRTNVEVYKFWLSRSDQSLEALARNAHSIQRFWGTCPFSLQPEESSGQRGRP